MLSSRLSILNIVRSFSPFIQAVADSMIDDFVITESASEVEIAVTAFPVEQQVRILLFPFLFFFFINPASHIVETASLTKIQY